MGTRQRKREEAVRVLVVRELDSKAQEAADGRLLMSQAIVNVGESMKQHGMRTVAGDLDLIQRAIVEEGPCGEDPAWLARHTPAMQRRGA